MNNPKQQQQQHQNPNEVPEGSWAIAPGDFAKIRKFGRALMGFITEYCKENPIDTKIIVGGFEYVMETNKRKAKAIADNFVITQKTVAENNLGDSIEEPFLDPKKPEAEEKASIAPSESPADVVAAAPVVEEEAPLPVAPVEEEVAPEAPILPPTE